MRRVAGLLADGNAKKGRVDLLRAESYASTFGSKSQRKRPKLGASAEYAELLASAQEAALASLRGRLAAAAGRQ